MAEFEITETLGYRLSRAHQAAYEHFRKALASHDLTPPQARVLAFLWREDAISQTELVARTSIDRTTMAGIVSRLEKARLVRRDPTPGDKRAHCVVLTERGNKLRRVLVPVLERANADLAAGLSPQERETLRALLGKLCGIRIGE
jgi:DNA-binding MarR family transcriptional regulator